MQRCRTNFLHPPPLSEENQLQLQIIASCISKACPDYRLKQYFTGSFVLKESVAKFCQRTNDEYGIYVCNTGYLQQLTYQKIPVKELDLSLAAAGTVTPDKHYLNVRITVILFDKYPRIYIVSDTIFVCWYDIVRLRSRIKGYRRFATKVVCRGKLFYR
jgi:hypothetical protein